MLSSSRPRVLPTFAVAVTLLTLLSGCGDGEPDGPDADETTSASPSDPSSASSSDSSPAEPSPTESASATPSPTDEPSEQLPPGTSTTYSIWKLAQGAAPAIAYLAADDPTDPEGPWSLVRPEGGTLGIPQSSPFGFALMGNGLVVLDDGANGPVVSVLDGRGKEVRREDSLGYRLGVTPDRSIVTWLGTDGTPVVVEGGGSRTFDMPEVDGAAEIGAITGIDTCSEAESEIYGCTVFVNKDDPREAYLSVSHGFTDLVGTMLSISDAAAEGPLVGLVSVDDQGSCSGIYTGRRRPRWQTCDHTLTRFSPAATRVLGTDAYLDGFGQRTVAFLEAKKGEVQHEFTSKGKGPTVLQTAWEDEDHVLAVVYERGRWAVVRLGADGSAELALAPVAGGDLDTPYRLQED